MSNAQSIGDLISSKLQTYVVVDWTDNYICEAVIGTPLTDSKWAVTKIDATWNIKYPVDTTSKNPVFAFKFLPSNVLNLDYDYEKDVTVWVTSQFNLTQVIAWWAISENLTLTSTEDVKVITWATIWWAVIPTTSVFATSPVLAVTWTASAVWVYTWTIVVQDKALNTTNVTIDFIVTEPI